MPRASTSVATRTPVLPARNDSSARSRWFCLRSPWMGSHEIPALRRRRQHASTRCFVRQNTITRSVPSALSTFASSAFLASSETGCTYWSMVWATVPLRAISTTAGSLTRSRIPPTASSSSVAEKSSVCRVAGVRLTILRMSGKKPMSSMRSASSSTSTSTSPKRASPWLMRSTRRPGVATRMSVPRRSAAFWGSMPTPPTTVVHLWRVLRAIEVQTSSICWASSRVGVTTSMSGPWPRSAWGRRLIEGSRNAAVLPVPVWAAARRSRPSRTYGMACAWTEVGSV